MIFCAAGDPGGSRALLPVIAELHRRDIKYAVLEHGFLAQELPEASSEHMCPLSEAETKMAQCKAFLFGSSARDVIPLALARKAKCMGKKVVHVLDNWSSYKDRLSTDCLEPLAVDVYCVIDGESHAAALSEGVPEGCLKNTGHPGLAGLHAFFENMQTMDQAEMRRRFGIPLDKACLVFVNEPLRAVLGSDVHSPKHYGFTEDLVLEAFTAALAPFAESIFVVVLPHPKDDDAALERLWQRVGRSTPGKVLRLPHGRNILPVADGVAGMASMLLFDGWLGGYPVLSLQPGGKDASIHRFSRLRDIYYTNSPHAVPTLVCLWLAEVLKQKRRFLRPELAHHAKAPASIVNALVTSMERL